MLNNYLKSWFDYKLSLWIFFCYVPEIVTAQDVFALKSDLPSLKVDSTRSRILYDLGMAYERTSPDSSFHFINQSLQLSKRINNLNGIVRSMLLAKELVELNGGILSVESKLGHGTTFYIKCPVKDI